MVDITVNFYFLIQLTIKNINPTQSSILLDILNSNFFFNQFHVFMNLKIKSLI